MGVKGGFVEGDFNGQGSAGGRRGRLDTVREGEGGEVGGEGEGFFGREDKGEVHEKESRGGRA